MVRVIEQDFDDAEPLVDRIEQGSVLLFRPAGLAVNGEGDLLVSDDSNGVIYRVSKAKK